MKLKWMIGLSAILISLFATAETTDEISCRVVKNDVHYTAKIILADSKVTSFSYVSERSNGHTCEVIASREDTESSWEDEPDKKTLVSLLFSGQEIAKVSLQDANPEFKIKILTPITNVCGLKGYIAKTVVITAHKKTCELQD